MSQPEPAPPPPLEAGTAAADACSASVDGSYDLHWHIAAIFIIMALSFLGTMLPVIGRKISAARLGDLPFQCLKLLGSGVILSTAFVHMLTPAQKQLTSSCLPQVFQDYGSWAAAIAIFGILFTHFVQCIAVAASRHKHSHQHSATSSAQAGGTPPQKPTHLELAGDDYDRTMVHIVPPSPTPAPLQPVQDSTNGSAPSISHESRHGTAGSVVAPYRHHHHSHHPQDDASPAGAHGSSSGGRVTLPSSSSSSLAIIDLEQGGLLLQEPHSVHRNSHAHADDAHVHSLVLADAEKTMTTYILELGIASHSIIIGLTLGAAREEFKSLFIALCFHQFFEGLALSTVVMDADIKRRAVAIGMVVFYSFTTPLGIALGIALSESFNENATAALIATGVLDALSAGILLYDGLANIIVPHFQSKNFRGASAKGQLVQFFALWLGAFVMAVIGRWA
ncbi:high-affinity Zn(2+) transporter zrt1 [Geranomyces michiganensis]|nr:high-affinity Zn(2+) transporter zrt1 [Geranomyces michiganensis]